MAKKTKKLYRVDFTTTFDFPADIEHMIFEWAAVMFPRDAAALSVLCRRIQPYVESVVYESLLIASNRSAKGLYFAWAERILPTLISRPSTFFAANVRNLWIRSDVPLDIVGIILSKCTAIRHLALRCGKYSYAQMVSPTAHTLVSLHIGKDVAQEIAQSGIVFPNLLFMTLHYFPVRVRVPPLDWIPSLKTVLLEFERFVFSDHDGWKQDIEAVLSTTPGLQLLRLSARKMEMPTVKDYIKGRGITKDIKVELSKNLDMELEWRRLFMGKNCF